MNIDKNITKDDIEAASELYMDLISGNHYKKQHEAHEWLKNNSNGDITRMIIERCY